MIYLEAQTTIAAAGGAELRDATLLPMPEVLAAGRRRPGGGRGGGAGGSGGGAGAGRGSRGGRGS